jgi:hypothetical protein
VQERRQGADASKWDQWAPASGFVFVGFSLTAWLLFIGAPGVDGSAAEAALYVREHRAHLLVAALLAGLALISFLVFLAAMFSWVRAVGEVELGVVAVGGGLLAALLFVQIAAIPAALAFNIASTADPEVVKVIYDLVWPLQVLIAFPAAALVGAISLASLRSGIVPRSVAWGGIGCALAVLVGGTTWSRTGHWSPSHGYAYAALFVFLSWIVVMSALLIWIRLPDTEPSRHPRRVGRRSRVA